MRIRHRAENPFPKVLGSGKVVVNETCFCNCPRSEHHDTAFAYGHGACSNCAGCQKYTFKALVTIEAPTKGGVN